MVEKQDSLAGMAARVEKGEKTENVPEGTALSEFVSSALAAGPIKGMKGVGQLAGADVGSIKPETHESANPVINGARALGRATGTIFELAVEATVIGLSAKAGLKKFGFTEGAAAAKIISPAMRLPGAAAVGFVDGSVFTPVNDGESGWRRFGNGTTNATSFLAMEAAAFKPGTSKSMASGLVEGGTRLAFSGFAGGVVNANVDAFVHGRLANGGDVIETGLSWSAGNVLIGAGGKTLGAGFRRVSGDFSSVSAKSTEPSAGRDAAPMPAEREAGRETVKVQEAPKRFEHPELVETKQEMRISDDVRKLYEESFPIEERQPTDEVQELIDSGRIVLHTTREKGTGKLEAFSFVSIHDESDYKFAHLDFVAADPSVRSKGLGTLHMDNLHETIRKEHPDFVAMTLEMEDPRQPGLSEDEVAARSFRSKFYERQNATNTLVGQTDAHGEYVPGYKILDFDKIADASTWTREDDNQPAEWRAFVYKPNEYDARKAALTFYTDEGGYGLEHDHPAVVELKRMHHELDVIKQAKISEAITLIMGKPPGSGDAVQPVAVAPVR